MSVATCGMTSEMQEYPELVIFVISSNGCSNFKSWSKSSYCSADKFDTLESVRYRKIERFCSNSRDNI